jgi:hypothetical protein
MFRVINRTKGLVVLPDQRILAPQKSTTVVSITRKLNELVSAKIISVHKIRQKEIHIVENHCIDPLLIPKTDNSPDLIHLDDSGKYGSLALSFKQNKNTEVSFEVELPPNYVINSDLIPKIDWNVTNCGDYGNVLWVLEFNAFQNWKLFKTDTMTYNTPIPLRTGTVRIELPKISGGGFKYNTLVRGFLKRMGGQDTYDKPAVISTFNIFYPIAKNTRDKWVSI